MDTMIGYIDRLFVSLVGFSTRPSYFRGGTGEAPAGTEIPECVEG